MDYVVPEFYYVFGVLSVQVEPNARDVMPNVACRVEARALIAGYFGIVSLTIQDSCCLLDIGCVVDSKPITLRLFDSIFITLYILFNHKCV